MILKRILKSMKTGCELHSSGSAAGFCEDDKEFRVTQDVIKF
jgi:hypothetical protein